MTCHKSRAYPDVFNDNDLPGALTPLEQLAGCVSCQCEICHDRLDELVAQATGRRLQAVRQEREPQ